jgi:hypothetical protein
MVSPPGEYFIRRLDSATAPFRSAHFNAEYFLLLFYFFPPIRAFSLFKLFLSSAAVAQNPIAWRFRYAHYIDFISYTCTRTLAPQYTY